ncbi:polysaccharide biosynthesis protein [candidate division KSB1 bacterium]|nr:polysaccharide biosynthesis protein [candidate division KSB1 bacterium]
MQKISDKIFRNTVFNTVGNVFTTGIQLIIIPYILIKLGIERFGIWALVSVIFGLFTALDFGTGAAFVKYFSEYATKKDDASFNRVAVAGFFLMFFFSMLLIGVCFLLKNQLVAFFNVPTSMMGEAHFVFLGAAIIFGYYNAFGVFQAIIKGLQKMEISNLIDMMCSIINFIGVFIVLENGLGLKGLIVNQGIKIVLVSLASIYFSKKLFKKLAFKLVYLDLRKIKEILSYGVKMQISNIAGLINLQTDKTIIGYFLNLALVTAYEIGQKLALFCRMIVGLILSALVPAVSELEASGKASAILKLYERGNKYLASLTFPILIFIIIFADLLINAWMGAGHERSVLVARLLTIGILINLLTGVGVMIVRGIGRPAYETEYAVICLVLNIMLGIVLVKFYGFVGVVLSAPISVSIGSIYFVLKFHRLYAIPMMDFFRRVFLKPFVITLLLGVSLYWIPLSISRYWVLESRWEFLVLLLFNSVIFFPSFVYLLKRSGYWDEEDKTLLVQTTNRYPILGRIIAHSI